MEHTETIIIGAGQAGLAVSYFLQAQRHNHLVLEKSTRPGHVWSDDRWDSFTVITPNWATRLPGAVYDGNNPHGYMPRAELVNYLEDYVMKYDLPVQYNACVTAVEQAADGKGFQVTTDRGDYRANNVVIATGLFQRPKFPPFSSDISPEVLQVHSGLYRNPAALPPGAVLVAGSGQSGCQIAEELYQAGRKVYLSLGTAGRAPRRYRGKDVFEWLLLAGFFDRKADQLPSPRAKFNGNPQLTGKDGGHTLNVHQFARDGVQLLGRIVSGHDNEIVLASDLHENLARIDKFEADLIKMIDGYIEKSGLNFPTESIPQLRDGYDVQEILSLDLKTASINTIIWAMGYSFDFSLVKLPVTDGDGYPIQDRGATQYPGLFFIGLPWLYKYKSGLLAGVGEDAEYIAARIITAVP